MNTVQLHNRVDFYLDRVKSTRWTIPQRDEALNIAVQKIIEDLFLNIKTPKLYAFEITQTVKDRLYTLVSTVNAAPVANLIAFPSDYFHEVGLQVTIDGEQVASKSTTYNELQVLKDNSFSNPKKDQPVHYENANGINVYFNDGGTFSAYELNYLRKPVTILRSEDILVAGPFTLTIGQTYYVETAPVTHNSITYQVGATFIAVNTAFTGAGTVFLIINCDLPDMMHDEVASTAAQVLAGNAENYNKKQNLTTESNRA